MDRTAPREIDPSLLGTNAFHPFGWNVTPSRSLMFAEHLKQRPTADLSEERTGLEGKFKLTDQHGARGVICEVIPDTVIPDFRLSDIPGAPKAV